MSVRIKSFLWSLIGMVITAILGVFTSDEFAFLVDEHLGGTIIGAIVLLVVSEGAKHLRNLSVMKKFGAEGVKPTLI